ncbi:hypothetical protein ACIQM0_36890 [Streptomyces sp. NPDC091387]|uniref:hypothetical protein n=1 Tax=Streptomyces sp. NPDC091387 TaxID=3365998 RepID=UPI00380EC960
MSSDRFPGRAPDKGTPEAAEAEILLIRAAMEQATDDAPTPPDLVPAALVLGRRRRTRARAAIGAVATGVVALGALGALLPMWGGSGGTEPARTWSAASQRTSIAPSPEPTSVPSPEPTDTPVPTDTAEPSRVHVEPSPGESSMTDLPAAERTRQEGFQRQVALLLGKLLPQLGPVRPVDLAVSRYRAGTGGNVFPVVLSVRAASERSVAPQEAPCRNYADRAPRCQQAMLPGGIEARAVTVLADSDGSPASTSTVVRFTYGGSAVALSVGSDEGTGEPLPVTADQLLAVAGNPRFLDLVKYAAEHPMETKEYEARVG